VLPGTPCRSCTQVRLHEARDAGHGGQEARTDAAHEARDDAEQRLAAERFHEQPARQRRLDLGNGIFPVQEQQAAPPLVQDWRRVGRKRVASCGGSAGTRMAEVLAFLAAGL
jgi:hypothetical protein